MLPLVMCTVSHMHGCAPKMVLCMKNCRRPDTPSYMFNRVLNMPLDYLSYFAIVLRGIHRKVDICQSNYSIHFKLIIFPYSEFIHGSTTYKLTKA